MRASVKYGESERTLHRAASPCGTSNIGASAGEDRPDGERALARALAWIDAAMAMLFLIGAAWLAHSAKEHEAEAVRDYGMRMDAGFSEHMIATWYMAPSFVLFGLAAVAMWRKWPFRWWAQLAAFGWLVSPLALVMLFA